MDIRKILFHLFFLTVFTSVSFASENIVDLGETGFSRSLDVTKIEQGYGKINKNSPFDITDIPGMINWNCLDFRVIGVCVKPPGVIGLVIMYWDPSLLIETVKQPGDTVIESLRGVVSAAVKQTVGKFVSGITGLSIPVSSGSTSSKITGTNLQFNEVHIYAFPFRDQIMSFIDMECPDKLPSGVFVKYLSELDSLEWRIGVTEVLHPKSMFSPVGAVICSVSGGDSNDLCMGFWGPVYPRRGFITHQSEVVASAAVGVRAVSIAGFMGSEAHVVLEGTGFLPAFENDKLQLIYPSQSGCIKIGQNPLTWENGLLSHTGKYLWVYWRRRICCIY